jgi:hypothetical protein
LKKEIAWNKKDPLHFWQSLAFTLRSADLTCVAVSSFVDIMGQNKLYIASYDPMTSSQQQEVTEIIIMFLDLKPLEEIAAKLLPRQLPYIIKQFRKCVSPVYAELNSDDLVTLDDKAIAQLILEDYLAKDLSETIAKLMLKRKLSLDDIRSLMNLIEKNNNFLRPIRDGNMEGTSEANKKMAYHLCKITRIVNEIYFVLKKIQRHQQDQSLKSISTPFEFISLGCHAELAILKTAKDAVHPKLCILAFQNDRAIAVPYFSRRSKKTMVQISTFPLFPRTASCTAGGAELIATLRRNSTRFGQKQSRIL